MNHWHNLPSCVSKWEIGLALAALLTLKGLFFTIGRENVLPQFCCLYGVFLYFLCLILFLSDTFYVLSTLLCSVSSFVFISWKITIAMSFIMPLFLYFSHSSIYFSLFLPLSLRPISYYLSPSVTVWAGHSWSALSHYPAKLASGQVCRFYFLCMCVCSEFAVYYLLQYSRMLEQWVTISDCTNTTQQTGPSGCLVLACPSSATVSCTLQQFRLCTQRLAVCYCRLVSSQRKA